MGEHGKFQQVFPWLIENQFGNSKKRSVPTHPSSRPAGYVIQNRGEHGYKGKLQKGPVLVESIQ